MKKILISIAFISLFSCEHDRINPSDAAASYSAVISSNKYEFITGTQLFWSGNYSDGFPDIQSPSGSNWVTFKKYKKLISQNAGDPYIATVQIWFREYVQAGTSRSYLIPSISAPIGDSHIYFIDCGSPATDTLVASCINNAPVSTWMEKQYYPYSGKSLYWKP
jgi:hypothetical protein